VKVFDRGDIILVDYDPSVGTEQRGTRPALVLSPREVNQQVKHLISVPITQGGNLTRSLGFGVSLIGTGLNTVGVILCDQIKAIDPVERNARYVETAPDFIVDEVIFKLSAILGIDA